MVKKINYSFPSNHIDPFVEMGTPTLGDGRFWSWGSDNLFPSALAHLSRQSVAHRRIVNDKADYISGRGFAFDEKNIKLKSIVDRANGSGESMRGVLNKIAFDKCLFGNAFLEVVTNTKGSFVSFFHQDASRCRMSKDKAHIILHHDWQHYTPIKSKSLPIYPSFEETEDGLLRSIIHYRDYEPMFENYGVPPYIAGLNVSAIAYKTDKWNISRLDNSFQLSGVMVLDGSVGSDEEAHELTLRAESKFAGKPGQVMFMVKQNPEGEGSKFIPISSSDDGDWKDLHSQATSDIVVAHSWFRSLSGLDYSTGFNAERILYEYEVALNTVITGEQQEIIEPIKNAIERTLKVDTSSLQIINKSPITEKPSYMMIWEARKADGLEYNETDPIQRQFISQI